MAQKVNIEDLMAKIKSDWNKPKSSSLAMCCIKVVESTVRDMTTAFAVLTQLDKQRFSPPHRVERYSQQASWLSFMQQTIAYAIEEWFFQKNPAMKAEDMKRP